MSGDKFRNRIDLLTPTLAFVIWAAHFSLLWGASSMFPDLPIARWIAAFGTLLAAAGLVWLWKWGEVHSVRSVPGLGIAIAAAGVVFDLLPAIFG